MVLTQNFRRQSSSATSTLSDLGGKVKSVAEVVGAAKGLYDVGRVVYHGARALTPLITTVGIGLL